MTLTIVLQFAVVLAAIWMGARYSGVGLGLWGAVGLLVLVAAFGVEADLAADRRDADHPRGDHGRHR
jgi:anaerobic C4-dicarboxylate transporter